MSYELKPCPFCGREGEFIQESYDRLMYDPYLNCNTRGQNIVSFSIGCSCGGRLSKMYRFEVSIGVNGDIYIVNDERQQAADDWNRRTENVDILKPSAAERTLNYDTNKNAETV